MLYIICMHLEMPGPRSRLFFKINTNTFHAASNVLT